MASHVPAHICLLFVVSKVASATITVSRILGFDGEVYYVPEEPLIPFLGWLCLKDVPPLAVLSTNEPFITDSVIKKTIESCEAIDDVFSKSFLLSVLLQNDGQKTAKIDSSAAEYLNSLGTDSVFVSGTKSFKSPKDLKIWEVPGVEVPSGPYVLARDPSSTISLFEARRLFFDETQSFYKSVHPLKDGFFSVVSASLDTDSSPYVGVPSRVYALGKDPSRFPLAGVRVTVKDIYYLKGLKASCGNSAFYETYGVQNVTSPAIARLVTLGADIIGIRKTAQFANGDRATADWVDYHAPFVPRCDGYLAPLRERAQAPQRMIGSTL